MARRFKSTGGFTLIELMIVLVLITLTTALIIPRVGAGWKRMGERELLQVFIRTLRKARLTAMDQGKVVTFRIHGEQRTFGLDNQTQHKIPKNVSIFAENMEVDLETGDHYVSFYPDGSQTGAKIQIVFNNKTSYRITLHPLFGTVRWEKEE